MTRNTKLLLYGYVGFAVVNYAISKFTAGTLRTGQPLLTLNDTLSKLNVLSYVLGAPTAPLAPGVTPVTLPGDTVTAPTSGVSGYMRNVVPIRQ